MTIARAVRQYPADRRGVKRFYEYLKSYGGRYLLFKNEDRFVCVDCYSAESEKWLRSGVKLLGCYDSDATIGFLRDDLL